MTKIKRFYSFDSQLISTTFQVGASSLRDFSPVDPDKVYQDDHNKLIQGDYRGISFPVLFKHKYGQKLKDVLDTGWPSLHIISDRMKNILEENDLTGWRTFPIKILDKKENEIQGFHGFSITGECNGIDYGKSKIIKKNLVPDGPLIKYYKGLHIDLGSWDNEDFFIPKNTRWIIVTEKVATVMKKNKISNIRLENLADIEVDTSLIENNV